MTCEHPGCTGVHDGNRPYAEWCPRLQDSHRETTRRANVRYRTTAKGIVAESRHNANKRGNR